MASRLFFNGRLWTTPATMSVIDDSAMAPKGLTVGNLVAYIGKAAGGRPNAILKFGSPAEAVAVLKSGELLAAVVKAFDPSPETNAPSTVIAIRVGQATQAALTLKDAGNAAVINLVSDDYGLGANQIKVKVESGSVKGKKLSTMVGNGYFSQDNIARDAFTVRYTGAGAAASITVTTAAVTLSVDGTDTALDLTSFPTVGELVDRINAVAGFTASAVVGSEEAPSLAGLDFVTAQDVKAAAFTVTANLQAIVDWLNGVGEGYVSATRATGAGSLPANIDWTYLSGAVDPTPTVGDWTDAFTTLQKADVQWVVPLTSNAAMHAAADAHCAYMSNIARQERRCLVGAATGTGIAGAPALAKALNSDRTSLVVQGYYDYDAKGKLVLLPPYMTAAVIAAAFAGSNPGTPLTNKALKLRGLEFNPRNPTDTDDLIMAGVLCLEETPQGFKVVRSISTWLINDNYNRVEVSTGVAADFVVRNVRQALDILRGQKGTPRVLARAVSIAETTLRELARPEPQGPGVIVGDAKSPAYRNITATLEGDVLRVDYECSPVIPVNFIPNSVYLVPYSGSASA
ncbi:hypothetical protein [Azospirillum sp.]|uniref:hypothetical protein n=1 Tax=Azospirillum sp. TaxID=34012 RepID=UPI003D70792B